MEHVDLNALIRDASTHLDPEDLDLRDLPTIFGDRVSLSDAFVSLLDQAGRSVRVATRMEAPDEVLVTLRGPRGEGPSASVWRILAAHRASMTLEDQMLRIRIPCGSPGGTPPPR